MTTRIAHDSGSPEGANSAYVVPNRALVVDPGPPGDDAWSTLRSGLDATGLRVEAVEHVVVTHWHADHAGNAPRLAAAADAILHMHEADAPLVRDYACERERRLDRDARRLREWGVPDDVIAAIRERDTSSSMPDRTPVVGHADGETVAGHTLHATPGHTAGHVVLAGRGDYFLGDAVLPTYTPNVGGSDTRLDDALAAYLDSLDRIERLVTGEPIEGRPGHGARVALPERIEAIRAHHADRVNAMVGELDRAEARTPWDVAQARFGSMAGVHAKMGAGEAAAHLEYAAERGQARRTETDPDRYVRS